MKEWFIQSKDFKFEILKYIAIGLLAYLAGKIKLIEIKNVLQQWLKVIACSRLLLKILADFQIGVYLQNLVLNHATTHSRDRYLTFS